MIVIPMAGLSRRFREEGYDRPKYMLDLHGRSLFAHSVDSFRRYFDSERFLFVARDEANTGDFVQAELARLGVRSAQVVMLSAPTLGQADTVRLGLKAAGADPDAALTVFNIDTFRPNFRFPEVDWMSTADGYLEVMHSTDPGFSFALPAPGEDGRVLRTVEKEVISDLASTGLYHFRRAGDFLDALEAEEGGVRGELYIAPLYNALIRRGLDVRYHLIAPEEVVFCGTPAQYRGLLQP